MLALWNQYQDCFFEKLPSASLTDIYMVVIKNDNCV